MRAHVLQSLQIVRNFVYCCTLLTLTSAIGNLRLCTCTPHSNNVQNCTGCCLTHAVSRYLRGLQLGCLSIEVCMCLWRTEDKSNENFEEFLGNLVMLCIPKSLQMICNFTTLYMQLNVRCVTYSKLSLKRDLSCDVT